LLQKTNQQTNKHKTTTEKNEGVNKTAKEIINRNKQTTRGTKEVLN